MPCKLVSSLEWRSYCRSGGVAAGTLSGVVLSGLVSPFPHLLACVLCVNLELSPAASLLCLGRTVALPPSRGVPTTG